MDAVPLDCCDDCLAQFQDSQSVLQSREITLVLYFLRIYSHTPSPRTFLFDVVRNGVTVIVSRIWSKANPYPYVFRTLCNGISASAQKKRHKWKKGYKEWAQWTVFIGGNAFTSPRFWSYLAIYVELIVASIYLLWDGRISMRADSCNIWTHSGSLQLLIIVTERWRKIHSSLRSSPASTFSRTTYIIFSGFIFLPLFLSFFYRTFLRIRSLTFISFCLHLIFFPILLSCFFIFSFLLYFFPLNLPFRCWSFLLDF